MKKYTFFIVMGVVFSLMSCGSGSSTTEQSDSTTVVVDTTTTLVDTTSVSVVR